MAKTIRHVLLAATCAALLHGGAVGTASAQETRQVPLTQAQIDNLIAVEQELAPIMAKRPAPDDVALDRALRPIEQKHGFATDDQFAGVMRSVQLVMGGMDPERKAYVGPDYLKRMIGVLERDKSLPEARRLAALKTLQGQLRDTIAAGAPPAANVELVVKNYDRLHQALDALADGQ